MLWFTLVLAVHVIVSVFLILVVLLQSGQAGDIASAFGGGGSQAAFGPRGSSNVLTKATTWSAAIFMVTSILLVFLSQERGGSVLDEVQAPAPTPAVQTAPAEAAGDREAGQGREAAPGKTGPKQAPAGTKAPAGDVPAPGK